MKKINKLLTIMLTIFLSINTVFAETTPNTLTITHYDMNETPIKFPQTFHVKKTTEGKYVYCMTYAKSMPVASITYTNSKEYTDAGIKYILEEGLTAKNDNEYFIYQTALWIYLMDEGMMNYSYSVNTFKKTLENESSETKTKIDTLVKTAKNKTDNNDYNNPSISLSKSITFTIKDDYYISNEITVTSSENNYKIELDAPEETTYENNNNKITIKIPTSKVNENTSITLKVSNSKTIIRSYEYTPSNSDYQVMGASFKNTLTSEDQIKGNITINKVKISKKDITTKEELEGATLTIKDESGNIIETWISEKKAHEINLKPGKYTLIENIAPEGYELSTEEITFIVKENEATTNVIMYNTKKELPKEEIIVPSTSSYKSNKTIILGSLVLLIGSVIITRNIKKNNEE